MNCFELRLGKDMLIGSDEEKALVNAIDSNFPASDRFLCTKHLKDGTCAYLQRKVGVPQKERKAISKSIFGENGIVNANDSVDFDAKSKNVLKQVAQYKKFTNYFREKLKPTVEAYVNNPSRNCKSMTNWTNNNCESLNHIMKLDANWKVQSTPALIRMLHDMTLLHFKDMKRALYGDGNYRLYGKYKKYTMKRTAWKNLGELRQRNFFSEFLKNRKYSKTRETGYVISTYSDFQIPALNVAKKPGQKSRLRSTKTKNLKMKAKDLRKKMVEDDD